MDTVAVTLSVPAFDQDAVVAAVDESALNGIVQEDDRLVLYVPADAWTDARRDALCEWLTSHGYTNDDLSVRIEPAQNWNAAWEQTLTPIRAGDFVILPSTQPAAAHETVDATPIVIDPEMSFGTGHHASTRLALGLLPAAVSPGDRVLDAGTGTGVLAIAACHAGAASVVGFDTHPPAVRNARMNATRNGFADAISVRQGRLEMIPDDGFNVILANITREVLRGMLPGFAERIVPSGALILAGLFTSDRDTMVHAAAAQGFACADEREEDGWWAARFVAS